MFYIAAVALMGLLAYTFLVGKIEVVELPRAESKSKSEPESDRPLGKHSEA